MKRFVRYSLNGAALGVMGLFLAAVLIGCGQQSSETAKQGKVKASSPPCCPGMGTVVEEDEEIDVVISCDGKNQLEIPKNLKGQARADARMAQWKRAHPDRDWVEKEKKAHTMKEPADNSGVLKGEQGKGHAYGEFSEVDLLIWRRETEKMVAEGSRIFHSGDLLGSTVGVSCDMCHPHASNTHPETYPKFQTQLGRVVLLRDMINWCIENPVRGKKLAPDSPEMRALEAYIMAQRKGEKMNYGKH